MNDKIECTIPVLPVSDLERSIAFYRDLLDFELDWRGEVTASVSRDRRPIMLSEQCGNPGGGWVWIGISGSTLFDLYRSRGIDVVQEPQNHTWAYEMKFCDPDGNVLWLGTETRADMPLDD